MTALTVLLFLFTLVMLRRIKIAVATLKVTCQLLLDMRPSHVIESADI